MSSIALLSAFDGAATPVQHDFQPLNVGNANGVIAAAYRESLTGVPVYGQPNVEFQHTAKPKNGLYTSTLFVRLPVMEAVTNQNASGYTAQPKVAHMVQFRIEMKSHERADIATRRIARQLATNILGGKTTTQPVTTTGPSAEMFDQLISPT